MVKAPLPHIFGFLVFLGFFAHLPDLGGDTPTRLLFSWTILFALIGFFALRAMARPSWEIALPVGVALTLGPAFFLLLGAVGHAEDMSFAWTPALFITALAALFIVVHNAALSADDFDAMASFAVLTQALLLLGAAEFPLLASLPGPLGWPSAQVMVFGGYWQVNLMANIIACLSLWCLWQTVHAPRQTWLMRGRGFCAFILFPLVIGWSNSFSGLLFFILGVLLMGLTIRRFDAASRRRFFALAAVMLSALLIGHLGVGTDAATDAIDKAQASSIPSRLGIWLRALYAFGEAPFWGHGLGRFAEIYNDVALRYDDTQAFVWIANTRHAHNIVLHLLVEIGLIGTFLVLAPFVWFGITLLRRAPHHWATLAMLTPLLGHMMVEYPHRQSAVPVILLVVISCQMMRAYGGGISYDMSLTAVGKRLRVALAAALLLPAMAGSVKTAFDYKTASARHLRLAQTAYHPELIEWRLAQPDLRHPFLGANMRNQAYFGTATIAVAARDKAVLPPLLAQLSKREAKELRGLPTWRVLFMGYLLTGEFDEAQRIYNIAATLSSAQAARLLADTAQQLTPESRPLLQNFKRNFDD